MGSATGAGGVTDAGDIAGAVTDQRYALLGNGGNDQLTLFAFSNRFAGLRIDDLGNEVVFPDMQTMLFLNALNGHTGPHDLGQAVDINGIQPQIGFNLSPHRFRPGLGAKDADPQSG